MKKFMVYQKIFIDVVIPVYNEEFILKQNVHIVQKFLSTKKSYKFKIIIADNGSNDSTGEIGKELANNLSNVEYKHFSKKGKGYAIKSCWKVSTADIISYMDADLSTNLHDFADMIEYIVKEKYDLVFASRLMKESKIERKPYRELLSRGYNFLVKLFFGRGIEDYQCGCKLLRRSTTKQLVVEAEDMKWFFDTQLLILGRLKGIKYKEYPIRWTEKGDSSVRPLQDALRFIYKIIKFRIHLL